ncbi:GNAT family N-acetyltransferase [Kitasatospora viridis]|uniref:RimJ/RimL family protein N-acetyltransferase n=1 Tax=Kitasatospora viridis TaxID=281105 RepID=A0A561TV11_9ACTN|nr:GNAT family protein [Kitasatospora viridis]TWF90949.1 RimJ/RimL family protein N-acetyltransferase [Kitasatospora viridis]
MNRTPVPPPARLPVLETARVRLRDHRADDLDALRLVWGDAEGMRHLSTGVMDDGRIRRKLDEALATAAELPRRHYHLAACLQGEDRPVGGIRLEVEDADTGYSGVFTMARRLRGSGCAPDIGWLMLKLAFADLGLARVRSMASVENTDAVRAITRFGFRPTGETERYFPEADTTMRLVTLEVLADDWRAMPVPDGARL